MKLHHLGFVFKKNEAFFFNKKYSNKIIDTKQQNYIYFEYKKKFNIWFEYIVPMNKYSTVFKYSKKKHANPHHFGFYVEDMNQEMKNLIKNNFILINKFKINVPVFGGKMKTAFFYKDNKIIELINSEKK